MAEPAAVLAEPVETAPRSESAEAGLALSPERTKELLEDVASRILQFQRELAEGVYPASYVHDSINVADYAAGRAAGAAVREDAVPESGTDVSVLLDHVFDAAMTNGTMDAHPGYLAHVPSGGLLQGAVGDFIAQAVNKFGGVWISAPGFQQIERNVIRWFCSMMGYGPSSFGYLTTGGSMANFMGLVCARQWGENENLGRPVVYASSQAHFSVTKAAGLAGIPAGQIRVVDVGPTLATDIGGLTARIAADRAAGLSPMCVVATAGTTNSGAIDDLAGIAALCRSERLWMHVDASFGGFFRITARGRAAMRGIEQADSIAVDAHKSLFMPWGSSALLVKDRVTLSDAFAAPDTDYLPGFVSDPELADFCNYGPDLSRGVRGLKIWLPLKMHGLGAFERALDEKLDLAEYLAAELPGIPGIEVVQDHPRSLPVVTFRVGLEHGGDEVNAELCRLICAPGHVYVTTTMLPRHGRVVRVCILHHRTDREVIDQLLGDVSWAMGELATARSGG